ncbi:MAG TPA: thioester reductase domain-containing protein [Chthoniobacterales bacterium]|nr:thioester reductase domain-containing protein [Chthoniobacterales bacterium]
MNSSLNSVFLTGATGVLGGRVLYELLRSTDATIHCLVRAENDELAKERIANSLQIYDVQNQFSAAVNDRVKPVIGDVSLPRLGLDSRTYHQVLTGLDCVLHIAGNVNLIDTPSSLDRINVGGTAQMIELCLEADLPLIYTSTYAVAGMLAFQPGLVFRESDLDVGQEFGTVHYMRSKFEAEKLIHAAGNKGLRWVITRPGNIFGDSVTGAYPLTSPTVTGFYYDIFRTVATTGLAMFQQDLLDMTPVDYIAEAIVALIFEPGAFGKTFHLVNPDIKAFYEVINLLIDYGYRIRFLPFGEYVELFRDRRVLHQGKAYASFFTSMARHFQRYFSDGFCFSAKWDISNVQSILEPRGVMCPKIDLDLLSSYLEYCIAADYLPSPADQGNLAEVLPADRVNLPANRVNLPGNKANLAEVLN